MSRTFRAGALVGALAIGVVVGGSANLALARSPIMAQSQPAQSSTDQVTAAIQQVIQQANAEQAQAIETGDASVMADTSTADHLSELQQINQDMADNGVTDIKLMRIEWGPITVDGNDANATTYETWAVHTSDGSTQVARDTNVYTLVQDNGAWKIESNDHPGNATAPAGRSSTAPGTSPSPSQGIPGFPFPFVTIPGDGGAPGVTTPAPGQAPGTTRPRTPQSPTQPNPAPRPGVNPLVPSQDTSHNWSGYAATGGKFTSVTGTWTIPQVDSTGEVGVGATWVGIGGVSSRDLIQAGTQETDGGSGRVRYSAWVETLPQVAQPVPFTVRPGDSVTVTIAEQSANNWSIDFKNNTTGKTYHTSKRYTSSHSSAEWVVEAPATCVRFSCSEPRLADIGSVTIRDVSVVGNGSAGTLTGSAWKVTRVELAPGLMRVPTFNPDAPAPPKQRASSRATTGPVDGGGTAFTVSVQPGGGA